MRNTLILLIISTLIGCTATQSTIKTPNSSQFKDKYAEFLAPDETVVYSWYHFIKTRSSNGEYIYRTFFPETKQMTSEITYKDELFTMAHGPAKYWHENGNLKSEGNHVNGLAEGLWKMYHRQTGEISAQGNFSQGKQDGIWKHFDWKGRLKESITYQSDVRDGAFIRYDSLQVITNEGLYKSDTIYQSSGELTSDIKSVEERPYLSSCKHIEDEVLRQACTNETLLIDLYKRIKYPERAIRYDIEGVTINQFVIEKDGSVSDIEVIVAFCQPFKDENVRVLSTMPKWEAGTQKGRKVRVLYKIPIRYKLE